MQRSRCKKHHTFKQQPGGVFCSLSLIIFSITTQEDWGRCWSSKTFFLTGSSHFRAHNYVCEILKLFLSHAGLLFPTCFSHPTNNIKGFESPCLTKCHLQHVLPCLIRTRSHSQTDSCIHPALQASYQPGFRTFPYCNALSGFNSRKSHKHLLNTTPVS